MEKRIELEKRHRSPDQVTELNLDNCKGCTAVEGLTDEFVNLHTLSLIGSGLTSLKGFPKLPKLRKLELSDNKISGGLQILKDCEKLSSLNLSGNRIKELSTLEDLKDLQNLRFLDLFNNDITSIADYRNKVFELLPQLVYLDGSDKNGKEYEESDEDDDDDFEEDGEVRVNGKQQAAGSDDEDGEGEEEEEVGDEEDSDEDEGFGLKDIYNDNLEDDDESDIYEEGEEEEEDHDISDESDGEGGNSSRRSANNSTANASMASANNEEEDAGEEEEGGDEDKGDSTNDSDTAAVSRGTKRKLEEDGEEPGGN